MYNVSHKSFPHHLYLSQQTQNTNKIHTSIGSSHDPIEVISLSFISVLNSPRVTRCVNFKSFCTSFQVDGEKI